MSISSFVSRLLFTSKALDSLILCSFAGVGDSMMPFTLSDLVNMSSMLLDVLIGLIQKMFSETRSNVVKAYGKAMLSVGARPLGDSHGLDSWSATCQVCEVDPLRPRLHDTALAQMKYGFVMC